MPACGPCWSFGATWSCVFRKRIESTSHEARSGESHPDAVIVEVLQRAPSTGRSTRRRRARPRGRPPAAWKKCSTCIRCASRAARRRRGLSKVVGKNMASNVTCRVACCAGPRPTIGRPARRRRTPLVHLEHLPLRVESISVVACPMRKDLYRDDIRRGSSASSRESSDSQGAAAASAAVRLPLPPRPKQGFRPAGLVRNSISGLQA